MDELQQYLADHKPSPYYDDILKNVVYDQNGGIGTPDWYLKVTGGTGGGDATAANQAAQITLADTANTYLGEIDVNTQATQVKLDDTNTKLDQIYTAVKDWPRKNSVVLIKKAGPISVGGTVSIPANSFIFMFVSATTASTQYSPLNMGGIAAGSANLGTFTDAEMALGGVFTTASAQPGVVLNITPDMINEVPTTRTVTNTQSQILYVFYAQEA